MRETCSAKTPPRTCLHCRKTTGEQRTFGRRRTLRGISGTGGLRLDAADLPGVTDEEVADALLRSEDEVDFRTRLERLRYRS